MELMWSWCGRSLPPPSLPPSLSLSLALSHPGSGDQPGQGEGRKTSVRPPSAGTSIQKPLPHSLYSLSCFRAAFFSPVFFLSLSLSPALSRSAVSLWRSLVGSQRSRKLSASLRIKSRFSL